MDLKPINSRYLVRGIREFEVGNYNVSVEVLENLNSIAHDIGARIRDGDVTFTEIKRKIEKDFMWMLPHRDFKFEALEELAILWKDLQNKYYANIR